MMTPTDEEVERVREFCGAVFVFLNRMRGSCTSWFRTPLHNLRVGGVPESRHLDGLGCDVVYDAPPLLSDRLQLARELKLRLIVEDDHDHLQAL